MRFFYHYIPAPIILLVIADAAALILSILLGAALRFSDPDLVREDFLPTGVTFALIMQMSMATFGLYQREFRGRMREVATRLVASFLVGFALMSFVFYIVPHLYLGRGAFGLSLLVGMFAIWLIRGGFFKWAETGVLLPRVLVLGTGTRALTIATAGVPGARTYGANIVGYLPIKSSQHFVDAAKILPDEGAPLLSVVDKYRINEIIIAVRERRGGGADRGGALGRGARVGASGEGDGVVQERAPCGPVGLEALDPCEGARGVAGAGVLEVAVEEGELGGAHGGLARGQQRVRLLGVDDQGRRVGRLDARGGNVEHGVGIESHGIRKGTCRSTRVAFCAGPVQPRLRPRCLRLQAVGGRGGHADVLRDEMRFVRTFAARSRWAMSYYGSLSSFWSN